MGKFFQQSSWLGIEFCNLPVDLDPLNIADGEFYEVFYEVLLQTYPNYSDLPSDWRDQKKSDAEFLSQFISKDSKLLSFGCGIGYLESCLMEFLGETFYVTDFSPYILKYRPDLVQNFLAISEINDSRFSQILLSQVTYALNESDLYRLMHKLHDCLEPRGTLIISFSEKDFSFRASTGRILQSFFPRKYLSQLKSMGGILTKQGQVSASQGWGYIRSKREMIDISTRMDFEVLNFSRFNSQGFLFLRKITKYAS